MTYARGVAVFGHIKCIAKWQFTVKSETMRVQHVARMGRLTSAQRYRALGMLEVRKGQKMTLSYEKDL